MDGTLHQLRSPWRTATLVASAVAAVELVLLVVLGVALLAEPVSRQVTRAAEQKVLAPVVERPRPAPKQAGAPALTRAETSVLVLNGNGRAGAAAVEAERVRGLGYTIGGVGNASRGDFTRSVVMYRPGHEPEARRLAADVGVKVVGPLDGLSPGDLMGAHVALVLGDG
ncbi:MAG TPA: LytR C-terminal domain-containing protein [Gaiellaceae bacterium]|nr:LytR C-terminal domain-containing protein [Gaiellaceae bacterium]